VKNKKHTVKQTKKMTKTEKTPGPKDPGGTSGPFDELLKLTEVLKTRPVLLKKSESAGVFIEKELMGIEAYNGVHTEKEENFLTKKIKTMNPVVFDAEIIFDQTFNYIQQNGGFNAFIFKIESNVTKIEMIGFLQYQTGKIIQHPPITYYRMKILDQYYRSDTPFAGGLGLQDITQGDIEETKKIIERTDTKLPIVAENYKSFLPFEKIKFVTLFLDQYFKGLWERPGTFAIPSDHKHWDPLLLLFAGDPGIVRKKAFRKAPEERTPEEQAEVDAYTENLFNTDAVGRIASVNILNAGNGNLDIFLKPQDQKELFKRDLDYQKEKAIMEFYKTIGSPEGLRHYLAIFQGLDRAGRTGRFTFNMNKHLDRLGYKKHKGETHQRKNKENALKIIQFLDNAVMDIQDPKDPTKNCRFRLLSSNIRYDNREGINPLDRVESIKITMDDWYLEAFKNIPGKGPRYTKLLDQLITEDHQRRWITLLLVPRLAILWRINGIEGPPKGLTVSMLLNVTAQGNRRRGEAIKRLEGELEYMKQKKYIGSWHHDGDGKTIHESSNPENIHVFITGPDWSRKEMESIQENRDHHLATDIEPDPMTFEQFDEIFQAIQDAGYSQENIARHTGLSRTALYNWRKRKRKISNENAQRLREFYYSIIEKTEPEDDPE